MLFPAFLFGTESQVTGRANRRVGALVRSLNLDAVEANEEEIESRGTAYLVAINHGAATDLLTFNRTQSCAR